MSCSSRFSRFTVAARALVEALDAAQAAMREDEKARASRVKLQCQCPRSISVAPGVAAEGSILCGVCESEFVE